MRGSNRRTTHWIFCSLILVSVAANSQVPALDTVRGSYIITITPFDDPRTRLPFDSCRDLNEISPMAQFSYPAGIAGFRYMLCTNSRAQIMDPGVRPLTHADLLKLGLYGGPPQAPCQNCVWSPSINFVSASGPGEDDGLLLNRAIDFFYGRYGKDKVSVESKDVEHGGDVTSIV